MQSKLFTIKGTDIEAPVTAFIQRYYQTVHESIYPGGFIRMFQDYVFSAGNDMMICLRADTNKVSEGIYIIEIITGGGGKSLLIQNIQHWSDNDRIVNFTERLQDFCKEKGFVVEG